MSASEVEFEQIRRGREGQVSAAEFAALENRLRTDTAFRQRYIRCVNLDVALETAVGSVGRASEATRARIRGMLPSSQGHWRWSWPAAAGLVVGLLSASVSWAVARPRLAEARMAIKAILGESFESVAVATAPGLPSDCGVWYGDEAVVVTEEQGVKPRSGRRMLRFVSASYAGDYSPRNQWSDVYRLVDVRGVSRGSHDRVRLSASFAQVPAAGEEQFACSVEAIALEHNPSATSSPLALPRSLENGSVAGARTLPLTGSLEWQEVSVEVPLSRQTQFVLLHVAATRTSPAVETGPVRFHGHYMDDVRLELVSRH